MTTPGFTKGQRVTGEDRQQVTQKVKKRYADGESVRSIAESLGRSYGWTHRIVSESGAALRGRGGANRRKAD